MKLSVAKDSTNSDRSKTPLDFLAFFSIECWGFGLDNIFFFQVESRAKVYQMPGEFILLTGCIQSQIAIPLLSPKTLHFALIHFLLVLHFPKGTLFAHMTATGNSRHLIKGLWLHADFYFLLETILHNIFWISSLSRRDSMTLWEAFSVIHLKMVVLYHLTSCTTTEML